MYWLNLGLIMLMSLTNFIYRGIKQYKLNKSTISALFQKRANRYRYEWGERDKALWKDSRFNRNFLFDGFPLAHDSNVTRSVIYCNFCMYSYLLIYLLSTLPVVSRLGVTGDLYSYRDMRHLLLL